MAHATAHDQPVFRILVIRSGGFAGITQHWQVEPVADELNDDTAEWLELVKACPWGAVGSDPASRDRFVWRIEASNAEGLLPHPVCTASVPDSQLIGPWRALVDRVQERGSHG